MHALCIELYHIHFPGARAKLGVRANAIAAIGRLANAVAPVVFHGAHHGAPFQLVAVVQLNHVHIVTTVAPGVGAACNGHATIGRKNLAQANVGTRSAKRFAVGCTIGTSSASAGTYIHLCAAACVAATVGIAHRYQCVSGACSWRYREVIRRKLNVGNGSSVAAIGVLNAPGGRTCKVERQVGGKAGRNGTASAQYCRWRGHGDVVRFGFAVGAIGVGYRERNIVGARAGIGDHRVLCG